MIVVSLDFSTEINNFVILIKYRRYIHARMILLRADEMAQRLKVPAVQV